MSAALAAALLLVLSVPSSTGAADEGAAQGPEAPALAAASEGQGEAGPLRPDRVAGGLHYRLRARTGIIHVYTPPGFDGSSAGTVVYVHGYRTSADGAFRGHRLAEQFRASRQNALFIVPDAPRSDPDNVKFENLGELLREVERQTKLPRPRGPVIAVAHSGGFRTVAPWLGYPGLEHVILLDGFYAFEERFLGWVRSPSKREVRRLTLVGEDTARRTRRILRKIPGVVRVARIPDSYERLAGRERMARILYLRSQYNHMDIVTRGRTIPVLLRRTPLQAIRLLAFQR